MRLLLWKLELERPAARDDHRALHRVLELTDVAFATALHYLHLRPAPPESGLYNGLQRAGYTVAVTLALVEVLSGLVLWKPVQLGALGALFGGYDGARAVHLGGLVALAGFVVGHVAMVAAHPRTFLTMITGGKRE